MDSTSSGKKAGFLPCEKKRSRKCFLSHPGLQPKIETRMTPQHSFEIATVPRNTNQSHFWKSTPFLSLSISLLFVKRTQISQEGQEIDVLMLVTIFQKNKVNRKQQQTQEYSTKSISTMGVATATTPLEEKRNLTNEEFTKAVQQVVFDLGVDEEQAKKWVVQEVKTLQEKDQIVTREIAVVKVDAHHVDDKDVPAELQERTHERLSLYQLIKEKVDAVKAQNAGD